MSAPAKLKVLLLENSGADALIIQRDIKDVAAVDVAINGRMFREMVSEAWDCILCDLALPDINGEEAIRLAKATHPKTPVFIVTGSVTPRQADLACESGASRFLMKEAYGVPGLKKALEQVREAAKREQEIARLEKQTVMDNRLQLLGESFSGFIHDLNNVLGPLVGWPGFLRTLLAEHLDPIPHDIGRVLDAMESSGKRGAEMSSQITAFVRGSNGSSMKSVTAEFILTELGQMLRDSFPKNIRVTLHTVPSTSPLKCDPTKIIQLLLNLCVNARDAMPTGGELRIVAQNAKLDNGDFVMIRVQDTGDGIPAEVLPHIFEPFFTTKPVGKGTGLGLSMAQKLAKEHGGDIDVKTGSAGTSFFLYVPVAVAETHEEGMKRLDDMSGHGELILVVDDEAYMRVMSETFLTSANYKVLSASNGMEALSFFRSNASIALLLTDCGMPYMSGEELARALRGQSYALPIVYVTGSTDAANFSPAPEATLRKPFTRELLLSTIHDVLHSR